MRGAAFAVFVGVENILQNDKMRDFFCEKVPQILQKALTVKARTFCG
jgi:hypothetical protein